MSAAGTLAGYNFAYLDEDTKRMIRRALLKAVAVPGFQVPFGSREMPLAYGWGTGGIQVTAAVIGAASRAEVVFTRGTTEAINLVASCFGRKTVQAGDEIVSAELPEPGLPRLFRPRLALVVREKCP